MVLTKPPSALVMAQCLLAIGHLPMEEQLPACLECASLTFQDQVAMKANHALAAGGALYVDSSSAIQSTNTTYYGNWYHHLLPDMYLVSMQCQAEVCLSCMM